MMRWSSAANKSRVNTIVEILQIRSNHSNQKDEALAKFSCEGKFLDLPIIERKPVNRIISDAKTKSISEALQLIGLVYPFSLESVRVFVGRTAVTILDDYLFLFQVLSLLSSESAPRSSQAVSYVLMGLMKLIGRRFHSYGTDLFQFVSDVILQDATFPITVEVASMYVAYVKGDDKIDCEFFGKFCAFVNRCICGSDVDVKNDVIKSVSGLFQSGARILNVDDCSQLVTAIAPCVVDLDHDVIYIICSCAAKNSSAIILQIFSKFAETLFVFIQKREPKIPTSEFNHTYLIEGTGRPSFKERDLPHYDLIDGKIEVDMSDLEPQLRHLYAIPSACASAVMSGFQVMAKSIMASEYYVDMFFIVVHLISNMQNLGSRASLLDFLYNNVSFSAHNTIFCMNGLSNTQNHVRNTVLKIIMESKDTDLVDRFIGSSSMTPIMVAEHLTRLTYDYYDAIATVFSKESTLSGLISSTTALQQSSFPFYYTRIDLARSITLSTVFDLMSNVKTAHICMTSHIFSIGFMSLIFEESLAAPIIQTICSTIEKYGSVPPIIAGFLETFYANCSDNYLDISFAYTAKSLTMGMMKIISANPKIISSFERVFDYPMESLGRWKSTEALDTILYMTLLTAENNREFKFTDFRFNLILDLIRNVDGPQPSENTFNRMHSIATLTPSYSLSLKVMILIPQFLPLMLFSFARSERSDDIINYLGKLCDFSIGNIHQCQKGDVPFLLLKAISGPIEYNGRMTTFQFNDLTLVFGLVARIVAVHSSYEVDRTFLDLIQDGNEEALHCLESVLAGLNLDPHPSYAIFQRDPLLTVIGYPWKEIMSNEGFSLVFYGKVDPRLVVTDAEFTFVRIRSATHECPHLSVFFSSGSISLRYDGDGRKSVSVIIPVVPVNVWIFIAIIYCKQASGLPSVRIRCEAKRGLIRDFREIDLGERVSVEFCKTNYAADAGGVTMGPFAFYNFQLSDDALEDMSLGRLASFNTRPEPVISNTSSCIRMTRNPGDMNMLATFAEHLRVADLLPIFRNAAKYSQSFVESVVSLIALTTKKERGIATLPDMKIHDIFQFSDISFACWLILSHDSTKMVYSMYSAFFQVFLATGLPEIFENILCNFSLWSDDIAEVHRMIRLLATGLDSLDSKKALIPILMESRRIPAKISDMFKLIELLCSGELSENDIKVVVSVATKESDEDRFCAYFPALLRIIRNPQNDVSEDVMYQLLRLDKMTQKVFDRVTRLLVYYERLLMCLGMRVLPDSDLEVDPTVVSHAAIKYFTHGEAPSAFAVERIPVRVFWVVLVAVATRDANAIEALIATDFDVTMSCLWILEALGYEGVAEATSDVIKGRLSQDGKVSVSMFVGIFYRLSSESHAAFHKEKPPLEPFCLSKLSENLANLNMTDFHLVYRPLEDYSTLMAMISSSPLQLIDEFMANPEFRTRNTLFESLTMTVACKMYENVTRIVNTFKTMFAEPTGLTPEQRDKPYDTCARYYEDLRRVFRDRATFCDQRKPAEVQIEQLIRPGVNVVRRAKMRRANSRKTCSGFYIRKLDEIKCVFVTDNDRVFINCENGEYLEFLFRAITFVSVPKDRCHLEMYVGGSYSILIRFTIEGRETIMNVLKAWDILVLDQNEVTAMTKREWKLGNIATTDLLACANILQGRSFSDARSPWMFPLVSDGQGIFRLNNRVSVGAFESLYLPLIRDPSARSNMRAIVDRATSTRSPLPAEFYVCRQFFGTDAKHPGRFESPDDFVYYLNGLLENLAVGDFLKSCLSFKSDKRSEPRRVSAGVLKPRPFLFTHKRAIRTVRVCERDGTHVLIDSDNNLYVYRGKSQSGTAIAVSAGTIISSCDNAVIVYDPVTAYITGVFSAQPSNIVIPSHLFVSKVLAINEGEVIFVVDDHLIYLSDFMNGDWLLTKSRNRVGTMAFDAVRRVLVYVDGTDTLRAMFMPFGAERTVSFNGASIESMLITRQLGYVVVKSCSTIYVYSLMLEQLKSVSFERSVVYWINVWVHGVDYVVGVDHLGVVFCFECMYPEKVSKLAVVRDKKVTSISFNSTTSSIVFQALDQAFTLPFSGLPTTAPKR